MITAPTDLQTNLRRAVLNAAGCMRTEHLCGGYSDRAARIVLLLDRIRVRFRDRRSVTIDVDDTADARLYGADLTRDLAAKVYERMTRCGATARQYDTAEIAQDGLSAVIAWAD